MSREGKTKTIQDSNNATQKLEIQDYIIIGHGNTKLAK